MRLPLPRVKTIWTEQWISPDDWLTKSQHDLETVGEIVRVGQALDRWDLEIQSGLLGSARMISVVEEHGSGQQLRRFRIWPHISHVVGAVICAFALLSLLALLDRSWFVGGILALTTLCLLLRVGWECAAAEESLVASINRPGSIGNRPPQSTRDA